MDQEKTLQIALFRFGLISSLIHLKNKTDKKRMLKELCAGEYDIPYSKKRKLSKKTILQYLKLYQKYGFEGLKPKTRADKNISRALDNTIVKEILRLRKEEPERSSKMIIQQIKLKPEFESLKIAERTVSRILKNHNLNRKQLKPKKIYRSFEMEHINILWQTDISDGIFIEKEKKKTYLFSFIDDYSRIIPHAQYYYDEKLPRLEDCLKKAILKRGIPQKIYADNGKIFISNHLKRICAELEIKLINHLPYSPQSKGKQERFYYTVHRSFEVEAKRANITSLEQLNSFFYAWLEVCYHRVIHSSIGVTPLDRFTKDLDTTKIRQIESMEEITEIFLYRDTRKVHPSQGLVQIFSNHYQIDEINLLGKKVEVRYDPFNLARVFIYYDNKFVQVSYPRHIANKKALNIPEENNQSETKIRASSVEFFARLKQKELELKKQDSGKIDFTKLNIMEDIHDNQ